MLEGARKAIGRILGYDKPKRPPSARMEAAIAEWQNRYAEIRARYDAAQNTDEFSKYWANADRYDADSAHSKEVRHTLMSRSRYEVGNNGYSDGIAQTYSTHLVGTGPVLRMQTGSEGFNRLVENQWWLWTKAVSFRRKLWCLAHAKHTDGEGFGILRRNPRVRHPINLDVVLYEADQIQTPYLPFNEQNRIDGIKFDEFGNPLWYELLKEHPGATGRIGFGFETEQIPANLVLHWFKLRRPGQHRGVAECASTLNTGAAARRWREATLAAAETAADFSIFLRTQFQPNEDEMQYAADFSTQEITKRMMTALPAGYDPFQMKAEQPTATYEAFHKALVNEQARAKNMPYNVAACDSSSYNYSSGRLDHQTYYGALDVDREDCNDQVLDPLFETWFELAVLRFGWLGGNPEVVSPMARAHVWDWPKHRVADVEAEANANETGLKSGQVFLHEIYADAGKDLEDEIEKAAQTYGVPVEEVRKRLFDTLMPVKATPQPASGEAANKAVAALFHRNGHALNGNGAKHD